MFIGECCQTLCNMNYSPVCGTDGVTYGNLCELTSQACIQRTNTAIAYAGKPTFEFIYMKNKNKHSTVECIVLLGARF